MLRFRRYRVFLVVALFTVLVLYHFTTAQDWEDAKLKSLEKLRPLAGKQTVGAPTPTPLAANPPPTPLPYEATETPANGAPATHSTSTSMSALTTSPTSTSTHRVVPTVKPEVETGDFGVFGLGGVGRHEAPAALTNKPAIHWSRMPEHFPVPPDMVIPLPTEKPKTLPRIQYAFKDESPTQKADREKKQQAVLGAFKHSWSGYKQYAWMHDELAPVSGHFRDPFCQWAATLVDGLDTLWIMGLEDEFAEAVNAVASIDFTTSPRKDIPVFETTIRYLGGLLSAYDVSGGKYSVLLDKAVQLADVLMGAFDTPNRMPIGYYYWRPTFATNPHRASTRAVMAEVGSMSVEFTRLAQLTKNNRYYDAIARITDEFEQWQNMTKLPGLWPTTVDTSGCRKPEPPQYDLVPGLEAQSPLQQDTSPANGGVDLSKGAATDAKAVAKAMQAEAQANTPNIGFDTRTDEEKARDGDLEFDLEKRQVEKRQLDSNEFMPHTHDSKPGSDHLIDIIEQPEKVDCEAQGLDSPPGSDWETFSLGGQADSTFEYLPKMFMLLGGTVGKYRTMYEKVIAAAEKHLMYRPMNPQNHELLFMGKADVSRQNDDQIEVTLQPEITHLTCFVGGMWAIGSKLFSRPEDLVTAAKLTDTCVWAYGQTATGIMPEDAKLIACEDGKFCKWDTERWYKELDPFQEFREAGERIHQQAMELEEQRRISRAAAELAAANAAKEEGARVKAAGNDDAISRDGLSDPIAAASLNKRQTLSDGASGDDAGVEQPTSTTSTQSAYLTHEEFVQNRLKNERIAEGIPVITGKHYILRPEAIESVFIMYRLTGDESWRAKGWKMFEAIERYCKTEYGYSAIGDVTDSDTYQLDEMESFWLAETLKYFYLLFSPHTTISLDEYVLNTEAHPMKRPR